MADDTDQRSERFAVTWQGAEPVIFARPGPLGWIRAVLRGTALLLWLLAAVVVILPLRGGEYLFAGRQRPLTGPYVQMVCRVALVLVGLRWRRFGQPMRGHGAVVANHTSWLDIFVMNAAMPVFFVSKAEVAKWPGINILTRVTDTHFVRRDPKLARQQADEFARRVEAGHRLLFFPEGTSTDGQRVLPFKPTLFQGFLDPSLPSDLSIQPMTAHYQAPADQDDRFYGWWGDMALGPSLLAVLAAPSRGRVDIWLHPPIAVTGETRKTLAAKAENAVRAGLERPMVSR